MAIIEGVHKGSDAYFDYKKHLKSYHETVQENGARQIVTGYADKQFCVEFIPKNIGYGPEDRITMKLRENGHVSESKAANNVQEILEQHIMQFGEGNLRTAEEIASLDESGRVQETTLTVSPPYYHR